MSPSQRACLRAGIARRFAKVYLETQRAFQVLRKSAWTEESMADYTQKLRRCDRLQRAERRLA